MRSLALRFAPPLTVAACLLGCGSADSPAPGDASPTVELGDSAGSPAKTDPTPVLPIPDDVPGTDPDAASKVPVNPIPDDTP
jgi:hypothetical protein